jgi:GNAT superfamily N-acetyltransferase
MDNADRASVLRAIRQTLAADCACDADDFLGEGVRVVVARQMPGRRGFPFAAKPLLIATMGRAVVISCAADRVEWAEHNLAPMGRDEVFGASTVSRVHEYVAADGQHLSGPRFAYGCSRDTLQPFAVPPDVEATTVEGDEIGELYRHKGFSHALEYRLDAPRPDVVAVVARRGDDIVAMAGASADSDMLWQIGVDVMPHHAGRGIGTAVVGLAAEMILDRGRIPYYSTGLANVRSAGLALRLGFWPAWVGMDARDADAGQATP